jgi:hypothetical protein
VTSADDQPLVSFKQKRRRSCHMNFDPLIHRLKAISILEPLIEDFLNTPQYGLSDLPNFEGAGVYALYLKSDEDTVYKGKANITKPIYIGKAVPEGSRQGRNISKVTTKLNSRIKEHRRSIDAVDLGANRFIVRFATVDHSGVDLIAALESALIRKFLPLWNSHIDGFGNHDPGKGRYEQSLSEWDTLHKGRIWASRLLGEKPDINDILHKIEQY